jgi:16S rRNA (guanine527-N7)-methyltransferase
MVSHPSRSRPPFRESLQQAAASIGRPLPPVAAEAMERHYRLLVHWGRRLNLTGLKDEAAILRRHFLEPIAAADLIGDEGRLIDLGSGNGFPAVPLKLLHPGLELIMIEATQKKSAFLWAVARELGLGGTRVETRRVEGRGSIADLLPCRYLTARAVRPWQMLAGQAPPILVPGGRALFFISAATAGVLEEEPIRGLRTSETRRLPSEPDSVVAVLVPDGTA